ncbi:MULTISPECIES: sodium-dependent transporter [unclassified Halobacterium]|uniref:sodium-dependent transporter n=1 Tax=unclassified Halobacterium TaxID=2668073 RepID=UPI001E4CCCBF|nr:MULTISPECIES: sodium-dependent transporter [unclassified Halobacterium]MCD2199899.1 sodium-dependent transporter [Halobacterium sp. KA-4]MCD2204251.1 sodium-dependent transporter [Halobacterium sp. KA-6]
MTERETWATRLGFILAAVGSAVGLGNIWQFPFKTGTNGGAAFVFVYLLAALLIGLPAILGEFVVGRRANINAVEAFDRLKHPAWTVVGAIGLLTGLWILSYYSVVGGWVIRYVFGSATGAYFGDAAGYFASVSAGWEAIAFHAVFMAITAGIVAFGVEEGIEKATKLMVPSIVVMLVALAVYAFTLDGSAAAYSYYLSPDFGYLANNLGSIVPFAVSQAFFSLSLGMGAMITYASYLGDDDSLPADGSLVVVLNTAVGLLAGLVVIPLLFVQFGGVPDAAAGGGPGALFVAVAQVFADLGAAGQALGAVFFLVVLIAALSSAISLLEVVTSYVVDNYSYSRPGTAFAFAGGLFVLGTLSAWNTAWLGWFDTLAYSVLLPLSVLLGVIFVGWVYGPEAVDEIKKGTSGGETFATAWLWSIRTYVLVGVFVTLYLGVTDIYAAPPIPGL